MGTVLRPDAGVPPPRHTGFNGRAHAAGGTTYWLHLEPTRPVAVPGRPRRLSWRVIDDRGTAVASGCRDYTTYSAAIDDARNAIRHLHGRADRSFV